MSGEIIGVSALRDILPCRPSMLLLDRVFAESENKLIGLKSISMNEPCFMGHFPGHPILPGVLQVEAIAQLAEVGLWKRLDPERKGDFYIKELHKIKFRRPNNPGDRLVIEDRTLPISARTVRNSKPRSRTIPASHAMRTESSQSARRSRRRNRSCRIMNSIKGKAAS